MNLHQLARDVIRESPSADPTVMAKDLVSRLDPKDYAEAIEVMSRMFIRDQILSMRSHVNGGPASGGGSRKVDAARRAWARLLDLPEYVPSIDEWVRLRDATRDQVLEMAGHRMKKAHENATAARRYEFLATEMKRLKKQRVRDLPEDSLREVLTSQEDAA